MMVSLTGDMLNNGDVDKILSKKIKPTSWLFCSVDNIKKAWYPDDWEVIGNDDYTTTQTPEVS